MMAMALQRRLVLGVFAVSLLLCVYFLCVSWETPPSWSKVPLKHLTPGASR